jgi:hypothetical protein
MAPSVWERASWAWIRSCRRASSAARAKPSGSTRQPRIPRRALERRARPRQQGRLHPRAGEPLDQPQHLPLAAAHLAPGIQMQDAHQLMFLAFVYLRNV